MAFGNAAMVCTWLIFMAVVFWIKFIIIVSSRYVTQGIKMSQMSEILEYAYHT